MGDPLGGRTAAVLGFGHQGAAQALNLRDAGARVLVGAREGGAAEARARAAGFETVGLAAAARAASMVAVLLPDEAVPAVWPAVAPAIDAGACVVFAHGFNLLYAELEFGPRQDVVLVAPTAPGRVLRDTVAAGGRLPAYVAVHRDGSGGALRAAQAWAAGIGCAPLWPTTVREETEVDLFGEQVVLCGGLQSLVTSAFETLVAAGYSPEIAYLEVAHQLRYLAEALHARGPAGLRQGISGTALYGDLTRGPRVIGTASRAAMGEILAEIQSGAFAREWRAEVAAGAPRLAALRARAAAHPIEEARRRALGEGGAPLPEDAPRPHPPGSPPAEPAESG
ncbi:MAG: ketol-acid reductoisomerase [Thermoleophilia bacterium]|nr:ketol-acid reductoisomerase [Thermoleophilia bacterium]